MKLIKSKLKQIIREELLKEKVDVDKVISILYKNLKKFSNEQERTIKKLSRGQDIDQDLYDALAGTTFSKTCIRAFLGKLKFKKG
tara:strand:+ start:743 stop:997 length:255 start_codon:yes stop_codon:yes gene_type:complete